MIGNLADPGAFIQCIHKKRQPVIFDTGALLAITHNKSKFSGPLTAPRIDLRLGGMANGLKNEGVGPVTWTFANGPRPPMTVKGMAYYVPHAKARLLRPQKIVSFHWCISPFTCISTGNRNALTIDYASFLKTRT